jgi:hypothetical protein
MRTSQVGFGHRPTGPRRGRGVGGLELEPVGMCGSDERRLPSRTRLQPVLYGCSSHHGFPRAACINPSVNTTQQFGPNFPEGGPTRTPRSSRPSTRRAAATAAYKTPGEPKSRVPPTPKRIAKADPPRVRFSSLSLSLSLSLGVRSTKRKGARSDPWLPPAPGPRGGSVPR